MTPRTPAADADRPAQRADNRDMLRKKSPEDRVRYSQTGAAERSRRLNPRWESEMAPNENKDLYDELIDLPASLAQSRPVRKVAKPVKKLVNTVKRGDEPAVTPVDNSPMGRLRRDMQRARNAYEDRVYYADILDNDDLTVRSRLSEEHQAYASQMVVAMKQPWLRAQERMDRHRTNARPGEPGETLMYNMQEIAGAVIERATMQAVMWMFSPTFREHLKDVKAENKEIQEREVRDRILSKVESKTSEGKKVGKRLQARYDKIKKHDRMGHVPFTDNSAALAELAINEKFYDEIRNPDLTPDRRAELKDGYDTAIGNLYSLAAEDGVDPNDLANETRLLIGYGIKTDPKMAVMYSELAFNDYFPKPDERVKIAGKDEPVMMWKGDFVGHTGEVVNQGRFTVREPMTQEEHQTHIATSLARHMLSATTNSVGRPLPKDRAKNLTESMFAYAAARHEFFQENVTSDSGKAAVNHVDTMFTSMEEDGLTVEEMNHTYAEAFADAMDILSEADPNLEAEWSRKFGDNWMDKFSEMVSDPENPNHWKSYQTAENTARTRRFKDAQQDEPERDKDNEKSESRAKGDEKQSNRKNDKSRSKRQNRQNAQAQQDEYESSSDEHEETKESGKESVASKMKGKARRWGQSKSRTTQQTNRRTAQEQQNESAEPNKDKSGEHENLFKGKDRGDDQGRSL